MSKPVLLASAMEVGEDIVGFDKLEASQVEAAKAFFLAVSGGVEPEAREIWKLASKFMMGGEATITTPAGLLHGTMVGIFITHAKDGTENSKLKEMLDRAIAIQTGDKKRGGG